MAGEQDRLAAERGGVEDEREVRGERFEGIVTVSGVVGQPVAAVVIGD